MIQRHSDWLDRLIAYLHSVRHKPLVWGQHDCCLFTADAIKVMTDVDVAVDFRGTYSSRLSALKRIKEITGFSDVSGFLVAMAEKYGMPEVPVEQGGRGDVAFSGSHVGIVFGHNVLGPREFALGKWPLAAAQRVWKV